MAPASFHHDQCHQFQLPEVPISEPALAPKINGKLNLMDRVMEIVKKLKEKGVPQEKWSVKIAGDEG
jgi:hypothetical protein